MKNSSLAKLACIVLVFFAATAIPSPAQIFTSLASFDGSDGVHPEMLVQGIDGSFYGTTGNGGATSACLSFGCGTVFKIEPSGTLTTLYVFCSQANCTDGSGPLAGLVLAADASLYGTTFTHGVNNNCCGTVFKIKPTLTLTTLYTFCSQSNCIDGSEPSGRLVQAANGNLYGATNAGGAGPDCPFGGCGTIFEITPSGKLTTLYSFCSQTNCTDGTSPEDLVQATNGSFYGIAFFGGANSSACSGFGCGTIFQIKPTGTFATLYSFCSQKACIDGLNPNGGLVQGF